MMPEDRKDTGGGSRLRYLRQVNSHINVCFDILSAKNCPQHRRRKTVSRLKKLFETKAILEYWEKNEE